MMPKYCFRQLDCQEFNGNAVEARGAWGVCYLLPSLSALRAKICFCKCYDCIIFELGRENIRTEEYADSWACYHSEAFPMLSTCVEIMPSLMASKTGVQTPYLQGRSLRNFTQRSKIKETEARNVRCCGRRVRKGEKKLTIWFGLAWSFGRNTLFDLWRWERRNTFRVSFLGKERNLLRYILCTFPPTIAVHPYEKQGKKTRDPLLSPSLGKNHPPNPPPSPFPHTSFINTKIAKLHNSPRARVWLMRLLKTQHLLTYNLGFCKFKKS